MAEDLAQTALARTYSRWSSVRREDAVAYAQRVLDAVLQSPGFSTGRATTLTIAGMDGEDVDSVDFVTTDGQKIAGTIMSGTLSAGDTIM